MKTPASVFLVLACLAAGAAAAEPGSGTAILDAKSLWRCRIVKGTDLVRRSSGGLEHTIESPAWTYVKIDGKRCRRLRKAPRMRRRPAPPPAGWTGPEFDDSSWGLYPGPFHGSGDDKYRRTKLCPKTRLIYLRGKFQVKNPGGVGDLTLVLSFEGGAVVYLNGKEVARAHMPKGKIDANTPAEDYPEEVYVSADGATVSGRESRKHPEIFKKRIRAIGGIKVPAALLRKGLNVLAVELHHAPGAQVMYEGTLGKSGTKRLLWPRVGLEGLKLAARAGAVALPARPEGFRVWNQLVVQQVAVTDGGNPAEPLKPVKITGARNGSFSGQVVAGSDAPLKGLKAVPSDLKGPGTIPASAVNIAYALPDGSPRGRGSGGAATFDTLEESPPAESGTVQPVWIRVRVPAEAEPGDYSGTVTVSAAGAKPVEVPVTLKVADWKLPDAKEFTTFMGFIQSPDSLAAKYGVKMWSPEHWKLVEASLDLIGQVSGSIIYIPLVAKTHFGNAHSMVRWVKKGDGWEPDFSIVEKYVQTAVKHLGKVPVVCVYVWEPAKVPGHYNHNKFLGEREILFSARDGADGKLEVKEGPKWGTPECAEFWKPVMAGLKKILAKHGLEKSMMVGLVDDFEPSKQAVDTITAAAPEAKWVVHSHTGGWLSRGVRGRPVGYLANVWGMSGVSDPDVLYRHGKWQKHYYGWKHPIVLTRFGRNDFRQRSTAAHYRAYPEGWVVARGRWKGGGAKGFCGTDGVGRMGADFWHLLKDKRGRLKASLAGHYSYWGGLDVNRYGVTYVLGPGKKGPVPTVRFEMLRECLQENEARFFMERILSDKEKCTQLGGDLAARAQEILDRRVRAFLDFDIAYQGIHDSRWFVCSGWQERSRELYAAAAEVAKKIEGK